MSLSLLLNPSKLLLNFLLSPIRARSDNKNPCGKFYCSFRNPLVDKMSIYIQDFANTYFPVRFRARLDLWYVLVYYCLDRSKTISRWLREPVRWCRLYWVRCGRMVWLPRGQLWSFRERHSSKNDFNLIYLFIYLSLIYLLPKVWIPFTDPQRVEIECRLGKQNWYCLKTSVFILNSVFIRLELWHVLSCTFW